MCAMREAPADLASLIVPVARALPSGAAYLAHLDVAAADGSLIRLASNESPEPPSPRVREVLAQAYESVCRYPPPRHPLRTALAARFGVRPEGILVGAGATELIDATLRTFVRAGDEVVVPVPSWPVYGRRLAALEARIVEVPLTIACDSFAYDVDRLLGAVTDRTKLIVLCSPNNPTGNSIAVDQLRRCAEAGPALLLDAAYADFDPETDASALVHEYSNLIMARTFSKAYCLAGLRVGFLVGHATMLEYVERLLVPGSAVSSVALDAGLAALADEPYLRRQVLRTIAGRERLLTGARALGLTAYDSRANFVAIDGSSHTGGAPALVAAVLEQGVLIRAMDERLARISVGRPADNEAATRALAAVVAGGSEH